MKKRTMWLAAAAAALLVSIPVITQRPEFGGGFGGPGGGRGPGHNPERMLEHSATMLDLSDAQKQQAKGIFEGAKKSAEPLIEQMKTNHQAVEAAVKGNKSNAELNELAGRTGTIAGQLAGVHTKAMRDFYNLLTPTQKEKADKLHGAFKERMGQWRGFRGRPAA